MRQILPFERDSDDAASGRKPAFRPALDGPAELEA